MSRDNWGRLIVAVLRQEELREVARAPSIDPSELGSTSSFSSIPSDLNSEFSFRVTSPPRSSFLEWIMPNRRSAKQKEKLFRQNGGLLLERRLRDYGASKMLKLFSAKKLRRATNSYNEGNIVGRGSRGTFYKGVLKDNNVIIVIRKSEPIGNIEQFINEVIFVSQMNHPNVVKLLGCCLEMEVPLLVYEFITNGTLFSHIHDQILSSDFSWEMRIKVAAETATALEYLHSYSSTPIVYGDIASSKLLLDQNYTAKVSDFRIGHPSFDPFYASEITRPTVYYCDPEYLLTGQITRKGDVYSFGAVLAELLTSQTVRSYDRGEEQRHIAKYFVSAIQEDRLLQIVDSNLVREVRIEQLERFAKITEWCLKLIGEERPSMRQVAMELKALRSEVAMELEAPSRVNWERLVAVVLRREEFWEIARSSSELSSRLSSHSSDLDSDFSFGVASPPHEIAPVSLLNATNENQTRVSTGSSFVDWIIPKRRSAKLKEKFFQQNGGLILEQISRDYGANETVKLFSARDLRRATNRFNEGNIVGRGSIGTVYKGILKDNRVIVVKKTKSEPRNVEQFINEVIIVSQINHQNLVKLLGCCLETEVPLLVYEFIRNGTLFSHIHDRMLSSNLSWEMRIKVAAETAGALEYLHSGGPVPIIHGSMASSNILLDHNYTAKLTDYFIGASSFDSLYASEITTEIGRNKYYCDPEYLFSGQMTKKSDVYSFGVVLSELLTSQKIISHDKGEEPRHIARYFISSIQENRLLQILDNNLVREDRYEQLERFAKLTEWCLKLKGEERPSMKQVAMELEALKSGVAIELEAPRSEENPQRTEKDVNKEEMMDCLSKPATSSNSNDGFLSQHECLNDFVANEKISVFTSEDLRMATDNYNEENIIGRGGYATVYKGSLTNYGVVAVKKSRIIYQGQIEKYINEVKILSQINHQNVVKILGCCLDEEVPLLVYEFITNGTLFSHLHDTSLASSFSWEMRIKIAAETAEALAYLHEVQIIHRDIKTANILIDQSYTAKVSDFGGSRFNPDEELEISEVVQGTLGYLDPEYLYIGQLTGKSDVYSFGVVLAELLTAKVALSPDRPKEYRSLALYFLNAIQEDRLVEIVDVNLEGVDRIEQLKRFVKLTEWCLKSKGEGRPSMKEVAMELEALRSEEKHP